MLEQRSTYSTQHGPDLSARMAKDEHEIEALMWRYARALDTLDAEAYANAYTPDGQFVAGGNPTAGTAALKKMITDLKAKRAKASGKLDDLGKASKASWDQAKKGFIDAYRDLATAYNRAAGEFKK